MPSKVEEVVCPIKQRCNNRAKAPTGAAEKFVVFGAGAMSGVADHTKAGIAQSPADGIWRAVVIGTERRNIAVAVRGAAVRSENRRGFVIARACRRRLGVAG